jgi:hypothetical protein
MKNDGIFKILISFILVLLVILIVLNLNTNNNQSEALTSENRYFLSSISSNPVVFLICDTITGKTWLYSLGQDILNNSQLYCGKWVIEKPGQSIVEIEVENPLLEDFFEG